MKAAKRFALIVPLVLMILVAPFAWHFRNQKILNENLISAVSKKDVVVARALLDEGANPNAVGADDFTKKLWNEKTLYSKIYGQLSGWSRLIKQPVLITAVESKDVNTVNLLLSRGALIESKTERGETSLLRATDKDNIVVLRALLKNGANVNARDDSENTALMWAAFSGNGEGVKILARNGADVNAQKSDGSTALTYIHRVQIAAILLKLGAKADHKNDRGESALTFAQKKKDIEMEKLLKDSLSKK